MKLLVTEAEAGQRVDVATARLTGIPRARVQEALRSGVVTVNEMPVRPSHRLELGDEIAGEVSDRVGSSPEAEDIPVDIRHADDRVLVLSKPAGLVTHPGHGNQTGTLVNALLASGHSLSTVDPARPGIVHRLDKDTSGLLLIAKDDDSHRFLAAALKERRVVRRYLALVGGHLQAATGTIDAPLGRHPVRRRQRAVIPDGRNAVTHYRVLGVSDHESLLEVRLETGRTHQIRVHLAHIGHPVLGDALYGGGTERAQELGLTRPFLHAWKLAFPHPDDGREVEVTDDLPDGLRAVLDGVAIPAP